MDGSSELAAEGRGECGEWTRCRSPQEAVVEPVCAEGLPRAGAAVLAALLGRLPPGRPCPRGTRVRAATRKSCWERLGGTAQKQWSLRRALKDERQSANYEGSRKYVLCRRDTTCQRRGLASRSQARVMWPGGELAAPRPQGLCMSSTQGWPDSPSPPQGASNQL